MGTITHECVQHRTVRLAPVLAVIEDKELNPDKLSPADREQWDKYCSYLASGYTWRGTIVNPALATIDGLLVLGKGRWIKLECPPVINGQGEEA